MIEVVLSNISKSSPVCSLKNTLFLGCGGDANTLIIKLKLTVLKNYLVTLKKGAQKRKGTYVKFNLKHLQMHNYQIFYKIVSLERFIEPIPGCRWWWRWIYSIWRLECVIFCQSFFII